MAMLVQEILIPAGEEERWVQGMRRLRSVGEENKGKEDRGMTGGYEEERMNGGGGGALFLGMQVLEIQARGRGFPLVISIFKRVLSK